MRTSALKILVAVALVATASQTAFAAKKCSGKVAAKGTGWRAQNTHLTANNELNATNATREKKMEQTAKNMTAFILEDVDVPEMEFFAETGVKVKVVRHWKDNAIPFIKVSGLGSSGVLRGSLLLPVSGHLGNASALKWAKTDTYQLLLAGKSGTQGSLVGTAKSLDLITVHELEIPLVEGQIMTLTYHRSGSGGPGGFPEGRTLEIEWDGT